MMYNCMAFTILIPDWYSELQIRKDKIREKTYNKKILLRLSSEREKDEGHARIEFCNIPSILKVLVWMMEKDYVNWFMKNSGAPLEDQWISCIALFSIENFQTHHRVWLSGFSWFCCWLCLVLCFVVFVGDFGCFSLFVCPWFLLPHVPSLITLAFLQLL